MPEGDEPEPPSGEQIRVGGTLSATVKVQAGEAKGGSSRVSRWQKLKAVFTTYRVLYVAVILVGAFALAVNLVDLGFISKVSSFPEELYLADSEVVLAGAAIVAIVIEVKRDLDRRDTKGVGQSKEP